MKGYEFQFGLRSMLALVAFVGFFSELLASVFGARGSPFFIGLACYCYGGVVSALACAGVCVISVLAARSPFGQRRGFITAVAAAAILWLAIIVAFSWSWPHICLLFSVLAGVTVYYLARHELADDEAVSPEITLQRLRKAKADVASQVNRRSETP